MGRGAFKNVARRGSSFFEVESHTALKWKVPMNVVPAQRGVNSPVGTRLLICAARTQGQAYSRKPGPK